MSLLGPRRKEVISMAFMVGAFRGREGGWSFPGGHRVVGCLSSCETDCQSVSEFSPMPFISRTTVSRFV